MDGTLARHFAHLFIRDPIMLFREKTTISDETDTYHFEVKYDQRYSLQHHFFLFVCLSVCLFFCRI